MGSSIERQGTSPEVNQSEKQREKAIGTVLKSIDQATIQMSILNNRPRLSQGIVWAEGLPFCFSAYNTSNSYPHAPTTWDVYVPKPAHTFSSPIPDAQRITAEHKRKILEKMGVEDVTDVDADFYRELSKQQASYDSFAEKYQTDGEFRGNFTEAVRRALSIKEGQLPKGK